MKIQKGHYVPKELITSEAIHEAVVKCFVAAGFKKTDNAGRFDVPRGDGLCIASDGEIMWGGVGLSAKEPLTLHQLFTAENGLEWPAFAQYVKASSHWVYFVSERGGAIQFISGDNYSAESEILATRQPKEKEEGLTQTSSSETISLISTTWWDYENQKTLRLPDVGEKVLFSCGQTYFVVAHHCNRDDVVIGSEFENSGELKYLAIIKCKPLDHATRKAELEKKKVVDAAYQLHYKCADYEDFVDRLYTDGYLRLPDQNDLSDSTSSN